MSTPPLIPPPSQPLQYAAYGASRPRRPGLLTAAAVIGIIVGVISLVASAASVAVGAGLIMMSRIAFPTFALTTQPAMMQPASTSPATMSAPLVVPTTQANRFSYSTTASSAPGNPGSLAAFNSVHLHDMFAPGVLYVIEGVASFLVAILLVVAAILLLRSSPKAPWLSWIYLWTKIPLIVIAGFATYWMMSAMMNMASRMTYHAGAAVHQAHNSPLPGISQSVVYSVIALTYPVGLLIVLSLRSSKNYFRRLRNEGGLIDGARAPG